MRFEETITLEVVNWPRFERTTRFTLDARLFPDEHALRAYVQRRFGEGALRKVAEKHWVYTRRIPGPGWFWGLLSRVLNKSYA